MNLQKIRLSFISKILFICLISVFFTFLFKYYIDLNVGLKNMSHELKYVIFLNDKAENKDVVVAGLESLKYFNVSEYVDKETSYSRAAALNPSLSAGITIDNKYYPAYIIATEVAVKNSAQFSEMNDKISQLEYVSEIGYDKKAFDSYIKSIETIAVYEKIFTNIALVIFILLIIKITLYSIKGKILIFLAEAGYGALASAMAYASIAAVTAFSHQQFFILNWRMLFVLIPLGAAVSFMTKESNV